MKVLFDPQIFCVQQAGGISRLVFELYQQFAARLYGVQVAISPWYGDNVYGSEEGMPQRRLITERRFRGKERLSRALSRWSFAATFRTMKPDLVHPSYYNPYFLRYIDDTPFVLTVYDMIHERYARKYFSRNLWATTGKRELVGRATRIIAISQTTKNDLVDEYDLDPETINVVHLGSSLTPAITDHDNSDRLVRKQYILFVGNRSRYKNFRVFVHGVAAVARQRDMHILCVGGGPFASAEIDFFEHIGISGRIFQRFLTDRQLAQAYQQAELLVFPSLSEGFGIPILEAFSCGCPVVASDIPVFREVAENAVLYFDPNSASELATRVTELLDSKDLRDKLSLEGKLQNAHFSWERCARETSKTYTAALDAF